MIRFVKVVLRIDAEVLRVDRIDEAINATINRKTDIDYLIVADRADVMGGKLYLMGGGFDRIQPPEFPLNLMLGIAVGIRVPYQETEDPHKIRVTLERADGDKLVEIEAELQTGRPPGMRGKDLPVPMAFNVPITVAEPGEYVLTAHVDGRELRRHQITASRRGG